MRHEIIPAIALASAFACLAQTQPVDAEKARTNRDLQIGGSVALDNQTRLDREEDPTMKLSEVALQANVALAGGIEAAVVLKAEDDLAAIFFDQAMATLTPPGSNWSLIAGQQTYNHGLLTTRLISDPEILPYLEIKQPGLAAAWTPGEVSFGAGLVLFESEEGEGASRDYALIPNLDWSRGRWQSRLSGLVSRYRSDLDLAASLVAGPFVFDAEGFTRLSIRDNQDKTAGYSLGLEYSFLSSLAAAVRHDGIFPEAGEGFSAWRIGGGLSYTFRRDLFVAAEYSSGRGAESDGHRFALRAGLKSTLHLPGFQRETLTQP